MQIVVPTAPMSPPFGGSYEILCIIPGAYAPGFTMSPVPGYEHHASALNEFGGDAPAGQLRIFIALAGPVRICKAAQRWFTGQSAS